MEDSKTCIKGNNMEDWITWMQINTGLAEKEYPLLIKGLKERIENKPDYKTANIIQKYPKSFKTHQDEVEELIGPTRRKRILQQIEVIYTILFEYGDSKNEIEFEAVKSVKDELIYQLEYWKRELDKFTYEYRPGISKILIENREYIQAGYNEGKMLKRLAKIGLRHGYTSQKTLQNAWNNIVNTQ